MKKKIKNVIFKIKQFINKLSNKYFYGKYKNQIYSYENKKISLIDYLIKVIFIFGVITWITP